MEKIGLMDILFATISVLAIIFVIVAVLYISFIVIDSSFLPTSQGIGVVVDKKFTPSHSVGKTRVSNKWFVLMEIKGCKSGILVCCELYNSISIGDQLMTKYAYGRFTNNLYIKEIEKQK